MYNLLSRVSLSSWDEAWYGEIAKNILNTKDLLNLTYNGRPFFDHPPFVMWLQALSMSIFGVNEFSVRLPSFILGIATILVVVMIGKEIFGLASGFFSGISLITAPWFLTRSMSGNLDITLTFLFVLTIFLALKVRKNNKFVVPLAVSTAFLFLTKSLVPFTIIPVVTYLIWGKINSRQFLFSLSLFLIIVLPWFSVNLYKNHDFIHRYLSIGYPGANKDTNIIQNIILTKTYLHNGVGNVFEYGFYAILIGLFLYTKKYMLLVMFIGIFLLPFSFSNKGHIWHIIPIYPFWILSFYGLIELVFDRLKLKQIFRYLLFIIIFIYVSGLDFKRNWYEVLNVNNYTSDIEILAQKSKELELPLILDDDAIPEALFYSDKGKIERTVGRGDIRKKFDTDNKFMLITRDWRLNEEKILLKEYNLVAKDRDKVLVVKK